MRKQIKILLLVLMIILTSTLTLTVNATDATVTLNSSETQLYAGDTFVVTMNVACEEGINGLQGTVNYDETKLELVSIAVADTTKWFNLGENLSLAVIHNSSDTETSADIVKVTLKVKSTAEVGTAKVTMSDIVVDSDATSNSMKQVGTKEIEVSIVERQQPNQPDENPGDNQEEKTLTGIEITKTPTKTTYTAGEKFEAAGIKVIAKYSDGSSKEITDYKISNGDKLTNGQTSVTVSYTEGNITKTTTQKITVLQGSTGDNNKNTNNLGTETGKKDETTSENKMPDTGLSNTLGMIVIITIFAVIFLVKYNKYKNI